MKMIDARDGLLSELRRWMDREALSAFIIVSSDPHQGEYVPERFQSRAYISGFSGSAGTVVVTRERAGLWTDSRYFLEAARALEGSEIELFRLGTPNVVDYPRWITEILPPGSQVGVDGRLVTGTWFETVHRTLLSRRITLVSTDDPFEFLWPQRPALPNAPVTVLERQHTGESAGEKLERIREEMRRRKAGAHVISTLDDIAWTLNLRGNDVEYNPVFLAYLTIESEGPAILYTDSRRITKPAMEALKNVSVEVRAYERFLPELKQLPDTVLIDPDRTSSSIVTSLGDRVVAESPQPSTVFKARKNATETRCLKNAHERDGIALVRFLAWLDRTVAEGAMAEGTVTGGTVTGSNALDEYSLALKLREFRSADPTYRSDSFSYISGIGGNGAIVHYSVQEETAATLDPPTIYLIDSGAQYTDGTTDITRTIAIDSAEGRAVAERFPLVKEDFTLVLKGHIALAELEFPRGKPGREIDAVARVPLWAHHRNYGHGTGHGVGYMLSVHEGPQKIAPGGSDYPLEPGMLCSNEPGLYREGQYGIRTENLILVQPALSRSSNTDTDEFGEFLCFETVSLCPIDRRLIDTALLTEGEREWINRYHRRVAAALSEFLSREEREWLERATAPLPVTEQAPERQETPAGA